MDLGKAFKRYGSVVESFVHKTRSKKNTDLISEPSFVLDNGVYILHETLGVRDVDGWNPKFNNGVIGILLIEDDHEIVIALEDSPENLIWSKQWKLVNRAVDELEDDKSDFNGEEYCRNLNSPDFPAAYYCLNYKKGGRDWYLPSSGELWLIGRHIEEIQTALSIVGGQKFVTTLDGDLFPCYWGSTERDVECARYLQLYTGNLGYLGRLRKTVDINVRPISKFQPSELKESFTKKISSKKNIDLVPDLNYPDGIYILHETLGIKSVEGWNTKFNEGVIGVLVIEGEHQIVVALEESPFELLWSEKDKLVNQPVDEWEDAEFDFNGDEYCRHLNSPDFPAAYFCLNYDKGGRDWFLPSSGELWMIYQHLEEIQTVLSIVGGQKFATNWDDDTTPWYWSSTEYSENEAWAMDFIDGYPDGWSEKIDLSCKVRPVSNFRKKNTLKESFTKKISSKKNTDLVPDIEYPDGVYILHERLGIRSVEGWNPKDNDGVVGVLVIEGEHQIVFALEDSPENLIWSKEYKLVNQEVDDFEEAVSDFNGEEYCKNLNSPDFPAAYYCLNYKKGGRSWYLPSSGELWLIKRHFKEIQTALSITGGQKFYTGEGKDYHSYWSSTERRSKYAWSMDFIDGYPDGWNMKDDLSTKVRPVSNFRKKNTLKESFTKKISSKKNTDLISKPSFVMDNGVYILHKTLGVRTVEGWNKKFNKGVVGILLIEDDHKIVVALEDSPKKLCWSNIRKLVNQPINVKELEDTKSDFNGEEYCKNLNSPNFPAVYYCLNYKKGGRNWYLPSMGELWMICRHFKEIQTALSITGGQKFVTDWDVFNKIPLYWSSTEGSDMGAWLLHLFYNRPSLWNNKGDEKGFNVRPISKFQPSELKESFTKKIGKKNVSEIIGKSEEVFDIYLDLKKFVFENNSFKSTEGWYYFDIKNFDSIPVCHEFLDDLEINDYNEYLYTYGNILLKKGKSWKDSKLMVEINKSDSSELYDDVVETVPWEYLSDYQGEQERIVDCLLET